MTTNALNIIPMKTDSCPTMDRKAANLKRTVSWGNHKFGDIILYDFNRNGTADHTGIVVGKSGSVIYAVEGNTGSGSNTNGGQVQLRSRQKKTVKRFVRPKYTKDVTPAMVVYTALGQVGVKESPKNSNKVKYNQWFYNKNISAYWCMTFVCWNYAHVETIPKVEKPAGKYSATIPTGVRCGSKGNNVKQLQKFLNWYHPAWKLAVDGDFGPKTMRAIMVYQNTEGLTIDGDFGSKSAGRAKTYKGATTTAKKATTAAKKTTNTTTKKAAGKKGGADIPYSKFKPGDIAICYDSKGKFHHIVLITDKNRYIDCTNTSSKHIAERDYSVLTKKYHVTRAFRHTDPAKAAAAVAWARAIAKGKKYTYKKWKNGDKKTKLCPVCNPKLKGKYKGWNCIGYVTAAYYHGAKVKTIKCSCSGLGTDGFFTDVTLASWKKRNGNDWTMITN